LAGFDSRLVPSVDFVDAEAQIHWTLIEAKGVPVVHWYEDENFERTATRSQIVDLE
jgi:hypothetical protein